MSRDTVSVLRALAGEIIVVEGRGAQIILHPEVFTRPMPGRDEQLGELFYGIDRSIQYIRIFKRFDFVSEDDHTNEDGRRLLAFRYDEEMPPTMPPEILSRRMQEVEAEWLRLGGLLEELRKVEAK